ncbi:hypothetical protein ONE63_003386 [Megalurothrips usitatus]|uniref:C2H2-type domain-containing protein n=1 Tax=Megalurothrips usitatus TaxID=439358 RepID=A0AAV7XDQ2_9NEOP|nr:hypothetical protein ONE63_003386 [Megalurothrips usitatus]
MSNGKEVIAEKGEFIAVRCGKREKSKYWIAQLKERLGQNQGTVSVIYYQLLEGSGNVYIREGDDNVEVNSILSSSLNVVTRGKTKTGKRKYELLSDGIILDALEDSTRRTRRKVEAMPASHSVLPPPAASSLTVVTRRMSNRAILPVVPEPPARPMVVPGAVIAAPDIVEPLSTSSRQSSEVATSGMRERSMSPVVPEPPARPMVVPGAVIAAPDIVEPLSTSSRQSSEVVTSGMRERSMSPVVPEPPAQPMVVPGAVIAAPDIVEPLSTSSRQSRKVATSGMRERSMSPVVPEPPARPMVVPGAVIAAPDIVEPLSTSARHSRDVFMVMNSSGVIESCELFEDVTPVVTGSVEIVAAVEAEVAVDSASALPLAPVAGDVYEYLETEEVLTSFNDFRNTRKEAHSKGERYILGVIRAVFRGLSDDDLAHLFGMSEPELHMEIRELADWAKVEKEKAALAQLNKEMGILVPISESESPIGRDYKQLYAKLCQVFPGKTLEGAQKERGQACNPMEKENKSEKSEKFFYPFSSDIKIAMCTTKTSSDVIEICKYCMQLCKLKLSHHVARVHRDTPEGKRLRGLMPKFGGGSGANGKVNKEVCRILRVLRRQGRVKHNMKVYQEGKGVLYPVKRPSKEVPVSEFLPCPECADLHARKYLSRHVRYDCEYKRPDRPVYRRVQLQAMLMIPSAVSRDPDFTRDVLSSFQGGILAGIVLHDGLILDRGVNLYKKHRRHPHRIAYIRCKLREMARLLKHVRFIDETILTVEDMLHQADNALFTGRKKSLLSKGVSVIGMPRFQALPGPLSNVQHLGVW